MTWSFPIQNGSFRAMTIGNRSFRCLYMVSKECTIFQFYSLDSSVAPGTKILENIVRDKKGGKNVSLAVFSSPWKRADLAWQWSARPGLQGQGEMDPDWSSRQIWEPSIIVQTVKKGAQGYRGTVYSFWVYGYMAKSSTQKMRAEMWADFQGVEKSTFFQYY